MLGKLKIRPPLPTVKKDQDFCLKGVYQFCYQIILHQQLKSILYNRNGEDLCRVLVGNPEGKMPLKKKFLCKYRPQTTR